MYCHGLLYVLLKSLNNRGVNKMNLSPPTLLSNGWTVLGGLMVCMVQYGINGSANILLTGFSVFAVQPRHLDKL